MLLGLLKPSGIIEYQKVTASDSEEGHSSGAPQSAGKV
jgi:hypothetical protein